MVALPSNVALQFSGYCFNHTLLRSLRCSCLMADDVCLCIQMTDSLIAAENRSMQVAAVAVTVQQARSPISTGAKVRHLPRPSLLNIDDDYLEANAAAGTAPIQASPNPVRYCLTAQKPWQFRSQSVLSLCTFNTPWELICMAVSLGGMQYFARARRQAAALLCEYPHCRL